MSKTSDDSLLAAGAGDKIVLFEMIYRSLAILTFVEKHPAVRYLEQSMIMNFQCCLLLLVTTVQILTKFL